MELKIVFEKGNLREEYIEYNLHKDLYDVVQMCFMMKDDKSSPTMERFAWFLSRMILLNNETTDKYKELQIFLLRLWDENYLENGDVTVELIP